MHLIKKARDSGKIDEFFFFIKNKISFNLYFIFSYPSIK